MPEPSASVQPPDSQPPDSQPSDSQPLGTLVASHLQRLEVAMLSRVLATTLAGALPPSMVQVERRRSAADVLRRQPGVVIGVVVSAGDTVLAFRSPDIGVTEASVSHRVRGVVLSTTQVTVADWLAQLAGVLNRAADQDAATRAALRSAVLSSG